MTWFGGLPRQEAAAQLVGPQLLLQDLEKRGQQYLEDVDQGKLIYPACKRTLSDAAGDGATVGDHTRLEAFRYLLMVPRGEFRLLADPESQPAILETYLRQLPHEETVIDFTGVTMNDLAIAVIAGFNWLSHCAALADAGRKEFMGTLSHFRKIAASAQKWWALDGARERCTQMLEARREPPLFLYLVWADYSRLANEIASARGTGRPL